MKYQSEILKEIIDKEGHITSLLHYESECIEKWTNEMSGIYPTLPSYQSEMLSVKNDENKINLISNIDLISNTNIETIYENGVYTYRSKPSFTGEITPSNILYLDTTQRLETNKTYTISFTYLSNPKVRFAIGIFDGSWNPIESMGIEANENDKMIRKMSFTLPTTYQRIFLRVISLSSTDRQIQFRDVSIFES